MSAFSLKLGADATGRLVATNADEFRYKKKANTVARLLTGVLVVAGVAVGAFLGRFVGQPTMSLEELHNAAAVICPDDAEMKEYRREHADTTHDPIDIADRPTVDAMCDLYTRGREDGHREQKGLPLTDPTKPLSQQQTT